MTTFWSRPANIRFCEPKYEVTSNIAEFFNSFSNISYFWFGISGLQFTSSWISKASYACLILVGLGSFLLHATLQFWGEIIDEAAMLLLVALFELMLVRALCRKPTIYYACIVALFLINISILIFYIANNNYEIFLHGFTVQIAVVIIVPILIRLNLITSNSYVRSALISKMHVYKSSVFHIIFGRIVWELVYFVIQIYLPM